MNCTISTSKKIGLLVLFLMVVSFQATYGQEANPQARSNNTYHNQLFFNRFLINPTFSLVRENKSYLNILHRNQYATFDDNYQNYFLGFSNKLNENTALGIGVYSEWSGVIQKFGFNANYATSVKLGAKTKLTFGTNVTYFNEGLDKNRITAEENDPKLLEARKESKVAVQPAITLSVGSFDFGVYAENLFSYNQTLDEFDMALNGKSVKASVQYTHNISGWGLFKDARLMPLAQMGKNEDGSLAYVGSILLDLPKYGWFQSTFDDKYGLSMGLGFNLSKRMSLGYLMEKDIMQDEANLGWNHELSLAYKFKDNNGAAIGSSDDEKIDRIVRNYEEQILQLTAEAKDAKKDARTERNIAQVTSNSEEDSSSLAYENRLILDELILRQDSLAAARSKEIDEKFNSIVEILREDIKKNFKSEHKEQEPESSPANTALAINETKSDVKTKSLGTPERKEYVKLPIKVLNQSDIIGVESGYYVIANVYSQKKYMNAFMNDLLKKGLNAKQFYNKENGLYYVYLADFDFKQDAETAFVSNLGGKYNDEKWIMQVDNSMATAANLYED